MKAELDALLCERYPAIFSERRNSMKQTAMCWGFECGDGWFALIEALCAKLQALSEQKDSVQVVASQVKEKFGGLRFYVRCATDAQYEEIDLAEQVSMRICEECGQPGQRVVNGGWLMVRCQMHTPAKAITEAEYLARLEARKPKA
ncbi:MAG: hypothetical protein KGL40_08830 [Rhodocyclaceae bacterium]|nr:hypothetical protein [Rhodocyclaceae bacterium]